ncbi:DNA polymerase III subunit beta [Patescibacteria group bacterium]
MKIHILQENLIKVLGKANRILTSKTQMPVLQNVLLKTENGFLKIVSTNLETSIISTVGAKIEKEGSVCVSSKLFLDLIASLPQETVILESRQEKLIVKTTRGKAELSGMNPSEFPDIKTGGKAKKTEINGKLLKKSLESVLFAAATDEGRPVLTGVRVVSDSKRLIFAATDGYRLSVKSVEYSAEDKLDMIVPARAMQELVKIISEDKESDEKVSLKRTADNQLELVFEDTQVVARLIDGEYPDYSKIIPKTHTSRAVFDKNEFEHAVKSASIFARDNANIVKVDMKDSNMIVSANSPQVGQNTVGVDIKLDGEGGSIAFNSRFLTEFLNNCSGEVLTIEMTGSLNPGMFRVEKDDSLIHIIMPVRVQN